MNHSDAVDQVVSMSLKGIEVIAKISGTGAKNLATYLYAVLKDQKRTKGKTRLQGLLRSGKELKVFAVKNEDLPKFTAEAKRYGVLYCALRDKKDLDGLCDVMVRAEDASKINRIIERFKLATVDTVSIKSEIQKSKAKKQTAEKAPVQKTTPAEKSTDDFINDLMTKPGQPESVKSRNDNPNPTTATMEKPRPSEPTYERSGRSARGTREQDRKSVRQELNEIRAARMKQSKSRPEPSRSNRSAKTSNSKAKRVTQKSKGR